MKLHVLNVKGEKFEFKFEVDLDTWTGRHFRKMIEGENLYEPESYLVAQALQPGDKFIDVGAHVGWYSLLASSMCDGKVNVEAFEPNIVNYLRLLRNISLNDRGNIAPHCMGMAGKRGVAELYLNSDNDGGHALWDVGELPGNEKTRENPEKQLAYVTTIDRWISRMTGRLWIKLDTEGTEQEILNTFPLDLGLSKAPIFIIEINSDTMARTGNSQMKLRTWFGQRGMHSYAFTDHKLVRLGHDDEVKSQFVFNLVFSADDLNKTFPEISG